MARKARKAEKTKSRKGSAATPRDKAAATDKKRFRPTAGQLWVVLVLLAAAGAVTGLKTLEARLIDRRRSTENDGYRLSLTRRPEWMPAALSARITVALTPPDRHFADPDLVPAVFRLARNNPWIRKIHLVQRRHAAGTTDQKTNLVEISAEFRKPVARVALGTTSVYVDAARVRLPARYVPRWVTLIDAREGKKRQLCYADRADVPSNVRAVGVHYVTIDGVAGPPPPVGRKWAAEELSAGLRLVRFITARPYGNQVSVVDVRNHAGRITRIEPHLRLFAQVGRNRPTDIRFGRFPADDGDYVIPPEEKMANLDEYVDQHDGNLAGINEYIDLRFDRMRVSIN